MDLVVLVVDLTAVAEIHTEDLPLHGTPNLREGEGKAVKPNKVQKKLPGHTLGSHQHLQFAALST
jgi:hypothetical protein